MNNPISVWKIVLGLLGLAGAITYLTMPANPINFVFYFTCVFLMFPLILELANRWDN